MTDQLLHKVKWPHRNGTACIIISPTRELSLQTYGVVRDVAEAASMKQTHGLLIGGANRRGEFTLLLNVANGNTEYQPGPSCRDWRSQSLEQTQENVLQGDCNLLVTGKIDSRIEFRAEMFVLGIEAMLEE